jgi:hypothetical protein
MTKGRPGAKDPMTGGCCMSAPENTDPPDLRVGGRREHNVNQLALSIALYCIYVLFAGPYRRDFWTGFSFS